MPFTIGIRCRVSSSQKDRDHQRQHQRPSGSGLAASQATGSASSLRRVRRPAQAKASCMAFLNPPSDFSVPTPGFRFASAEGIEFPVGNPAATREYIEVQKTGKRDLLRLPQTRHGVTASWNGRRRTGKHAGPIIAFCSRVNPCPYRQPQTNASCRADIGANAEKFRVPQVRPAVAADVAKCTSSARVTSTTSYLCLLIPHSNGTGARGRPASRRTHRFDIQNQLLKVASQAVAVHS
jgi:hypothetical protein